MGGFKIVISFKLSFQLCKNTIDFVLNKIYCIPAVSTSVLTFFINP